MTPRYLIVTLSVLSSLQSLSLAVRISNMFSFSTPPRYQPLDGDHVFLYTRGSSFFLHLIPGRPFSSTNIGQNVSKPDGEVSKDLRLRLSFCPPRRVVRKPSFLLHGDDHLEEELQINMFCNGEDAGGEKDFMDVESGQRRSCWVLDVKEHLKMYFQVKKDWGRHSVGLIKCSEGDSRAWAYSGTIMSRGLGNVWRHVGKDEMTLAITLWVVSALYFLSLLMVILALIFRLRIPINEEQKGVGRMRVLIVVSLLLKVLNLTFLSAFWGILWIHGRRKIALVNLRAPGLVGADISVLTLAIMSARGDGILGPADRPAHGKLQTLFAVGTLSSYAIASLIFALSSASYVTAAFLFFSAGSLTFYVWTQCMRSKSVLLNHMNLIREFGVSPKSTPYYIRTKYYNRLPFFIAACFFARSGAFLVIDRIIETPRPWFLFVCLEVIDMLIIFVLAVLFIAQRYTLLFSKIPTTFASHIETVQDEEVGENHDFPSGLLDSDGLRIWESGIPLPPINRYRRARRSNFRHIGRLGEEHSVAGSSEAAFTEGCKVVSELTEDGRRRSLGLAVPVTGALDTARAVNSADTSWREDENEPTDENGPTDEDEKSGIQIGPVTPEGSEDGFILRASLDGREGIG